MAEKFSYEPPANRKCMLCRNKSQNLQRPPRPNELFWFCPRCAHSFTDGIKQRTRNSVMRSQARADGYEHTAEDYDALEAAQIVYWKIERFYMIESFQRVLRTQFGRGA